MIKDRFDNKRQDVFYDGNRQVTQDRPTIQNGIGGSTDPYAAMEDVRQRKEEYKELVSDVFNKLSEFNYQSFGASSYDYTYPKMFTRFDRFNKKFYTPNQVYSGYTFITRPRLCLTGSNLQANRYLQLFNTVKPDTIQFALRCLLDTKFSAPTSTATQNIWRCPYFDPYNPFIPILSNTLQDFSGTPSQHITTFTTEGGYFSEDLKLASGSDRNNGSVDLNLTFTDIEGGLVMALFKLWLTYIDLVTVGEVIAYPDDIIHQRINYTCSIYRFVVDPTNRFIDYAFKYTGCFPVDRPFGAIADVSRSEKYVEAAKNFTIQFVCNKVEDNDPIIPLEFNTLMQRYCPEIAISNSVTVNGQQISGMQSVPYDLSYNFVGLPYIVINSNHKPYLDFRYRPLQTKTSQQTLQETEEAINQLSSTYNGANTWV